MRQRKLYLSELLNRCTNKEISLTIKTMFAYHYFDMSTQSIDKLKKDKWLDKQVKSWYIRHGTLRTSLIVTIDDD